MSEMTQDASRFKRIFEAAPQAVGIADAEGNITAVNPAYTRMFGYTQAEIPTLALCFEKLFPDPLYRDWVAQRWGKSLEQFARTGIPSEPVIFHFRAKDGSERVAEIRSTTDAGETIAFFLDVTEQHKAKERAKLWRSVLGQSTEGIMRNAYQFYTSDLNERVLETLSMEAALRQALERGEFVLHYQPQIDMASGRVVAAEALIRWHRPGAGLVSPGQFIPIAEERGLIGKIGLWVIEETCRQIVAWDKAGLPAIPIAVNVSSLQFHQSGFAEQVARTIQRFGVASHRLELELTESLMVQDMKATTGVLHQLHDLGVRLAIDDFGTGYSSLNYLRRLPIDKVKIDQSFVGEMTEHADTVRVVRGIIGLARSLNLAVIAEGVETDDQLAILRVEGCDEVQGFLFSPALPAGEFEKLVRTWRFRVATRSRRERPGHLRPAVNALR